MEKKVVFINIFCTLIAQVVSIISGFVVPRILLSMFGSNINGLVSSMTQFLGYIQILEGGLGSLILATLYKPLNENNQEKVSSIVNAADYFFKKIGFIFIIYLVGVAFIYPLFVNTGVSYSYSVALIVVLGVNLIVQYFFSVTYRLLLQADRKIYFISFVQIISTVINIGIVIVCSTLFQDILLLKLFGIIAYFISPICFNYYVKKHYKIDRRLPKDNEALEQRWDGFGINLAYFIHTNTDIIILTIFSTFANISVYAVYGMIVTAIKNLVISISSAIVPSFGKVLAENDVKQTEKAFDIYEYGMGFISTVIFTCGMILITPFVLVYTKGITDANYNQFTFGIVLCMSEMVYCIRDPYISATYASGRFRDVSKYAYLEATINIVISLLLVKPLGLLGIVIGTFIAMLYREVAHVFYLKRNVLHRPVRKAIKSLVIHAVGCICPMLIVFQFMDLVCQSYFDWMLCGIKVFFITLLVNIVIGVLFYRDCITENVGKWFGHRIKK